MPAMAVTLEILFPIGSGGCGENKRVVLCKKCKGRTGTRKGKQLRCLTLVNFLPFRFCMIKSSPVQVTSSPILYSWWWWLIVTYMTNVDMRCMFNMYKVYYVYSCSSMSSVSNKAVSWSLSTLQCLTGVRYISWLICLLPGHWHRPLPYRICHSDMLFWNCIMLGIEHSSKYSGMKTDYWKRCTTIYLQCS